MRDNWTSGELVGMANMVAQGIPAGESAEEFCRRLLYVAITDGLVYPATCDCGRALCRGTCRICDNDE
jgi:hypothetical protein